MMGAQHISSSVEHRSQFLNYQAVAAETDG
jgi:hypothetical protein